MYSGVEVDTSFTLSHLQYADDTILIDKESFNNLSVIKAVLRCFEMVPGLKVNFFKSCLYGVNVGDQFLSAGSSFLVCLKYKLSFTYLGLPVGANPRSVFTWQPVIKMIRKRVSRWEVRRLSVGGKIMLLKSVVFIFITYPSSEHQGKS